MPQELDIPPDTHISYNDAVKYWSSVPATVDGVLGGFGNSVIPKVDIVGSNTFLSALKTMGEFGKVPQEKRIAADIGAGIGRVSKNFLSKHCSAIDLVEPVEQFVQQAKADLQPEIENGVDINFIEQGAQNFEPEPSRYWLIWCQWCLGHLSDENLIFFFKRCARALQPNGIIVVKENNCHMQDEFDDTDSSVTRTDAKFRELFSEAGLHLLYYKKQVGMPKTVYPVTMYALIPEERLKK